MKKLYRIFTHRLTGGFRRKASTAIQQQQQPQHPRAAEIPQELSDLVVLENNSGEDDLENKRAELTWVISIKEQIQRARQENEAPPWAEHSIYRIPRNLKYGKVEAYIPHMVSLGPYHHHKKHLCQMDRHKWRCLDRILRRTKKNIDDFLASVKEVEKKARACYEGTISMRSEEFVAMMVLDGCFVIELFLGFIWGFPKLGYRSDDPVFSTQGSMHTIRQDMIMLENQIPLFILERLLSLQLREPSQMGLVAKMAFLFFKPLKPTDGRLVNCKEQKKLETPQGEFHCLEVFRESLLYPRPKKVDPKGFSQRRHEIIHCVTDLRKAGIKFRKRRTDVFWDIRFKCGILQIPPLMIDDGTRSLFLNLIAFEQRRINCGNAITSYVVFMDNLINSPEDVGYLHDRGIIEHWLGSDAEVADLFNQLCKEVVFDINISYLSEVSEQVNTYTSYRWNGWIASLKLKYFSNPWSIISLLVASALLVLTSVQTFYGVYGYYNPRS